MILSRGQKLVRARKKLVRATGKLIRAWRFAATPATGDGFRWELGAIRGPSAHHASHRRIGRQPWDGSGEDIRARQLQWRKQLEPRTDDPAEPPPLPASHAPQPSQEPTRAERKGVP